MTAQQDLIHLLRDRGMRVTPQRLVILRELHRLGRHATAEEIHRAVNDELPGISTPTVYATLDLLVELGLARKLDIGTRGALYDARVEAHQHMVCRRCGRVDDLDGSFNASRLLRLATDAGFQPEGAELVISGPCADCAKAQQAA